MTSSLGDVFEPDAEVRIPGAEEATISAAQQRLRYPLPDSYLHLLRVQNGGSLRRTRFETDFATSWALDHFVVEALRGIGDAPMALDGDVGSDYMIREWGYPDIGLVIGVTPSGGHDAAMLDYRAPRSAVEPCVVYIDEDRVPRPVADSLPEFLGRLTPRG